MKKFLNVIMILGLVLLLTSCKKEEIEEETTTPTTSEALPSLTESVVETVVEDYPFSHLSNLGYYKYLNHSNPVVIIEVLDYGEFVLQLFPDVAKLTVDNFIKYIENNKYEGSTFHRVIEDFMIQGGIVKVPYYPVVGEFSRNGYKNDLKHERGVISMARTNIFDSATSQFFIVHETSPHLDGLYAGFGALINGFEILDEIARVSVDGGDKPLEDVVIKGMTVYLRGYEK